jgi:hypothetical protein
MAYVNYLWFSSFNFDPLTRWIQQLNYWLHTLCLSVLQKEIPSSDTELEEQTRSQPEACQYVLFIAHSPTYLLIASYRKGVGQKKVHNRVPRARFACSLIYNFYWSLVNESLAADKTLVYFIERCSFLGRLISCLLKKGHRILVFSSML